MSYRMSNNTGITVCRTLFEKLHLLSDGELEILLATNTIVSICNMLVNFMLIALIKSTKQYINPSLRLTMYMSISDFFVGAISQQMLSYFIANAEANISCELQVFLQYILYLFPHMTGFLVGMVALDRYVRVKYANKYNDVMTFKRQTIGVIIVIILSILNCMMLISGIFTGNWTVALLGIQPLDMTFVTCDVLLYWRAIVIMKEHMKANSIEMKHFSRSISKLATIYMVLVIIFYPPYLLLDMIQVFVNSNKTTVVFWHIMTLIWVFLNSGINGISFVIVNRKAQRKLKEWKAIVFRQAKIEPQQQRDRDKETETDM